MGFNPSMLFGLLLVVIYFLVAVRLVKSRFARKRTVRAEVIGKQTVEQFSKYAGNGKRVKYVVIFQTEGKKLSFYVSQFSYGGYRLHEKGTLTYQGDRLIDFH